MYEVELKVRADHDRVRGRLAELDADPAGRVRQVDTYYDAPHRDFAETDEALRVRRETPLGGARDGGADTETSLAYKGPPVGDGAKTREEHETAVADGEALAAALGGLGFEPAATVRKERERYDLDGATVTLDTVADLGEFVEVEREADAAGVDAARERARELLERLGGDPDRRVRSSYLGLLLPGGE